MWRRIVGFLLTLVADGFFVVVPEVRRVSSHKVVRRCLEGSNNLTVEAPIQQQIAWNKQITGYGATSEAILMLCERQSRRFSARNLATAAHRVAKFRGREVVAIDPRLLRFAEVCKIRMSHFDARGLAMVAWGFARVGFREQDLFDEIAKVALSKKMDSFSTRELANLAWAFAKSSRSQETFFDKIAEEATLHIKKFESTKDLAMTAYAFALASEDSEKRNFLFEAIASEAIDRIDSFNGQDLANTAWAFAKTNVECRRLFDAIERAVVDRNEEFTSQALSNLLWAFAARGHEAPRLFDFVGEEIRHKDFNAQSLSNIAWAFATADHKAPRVFDLLAESIRISDLTTQGLANVAWAFAKANHTSVLLFEKIADECLLYEKQFHSQELANILWAFAVLQEPAPKLFHALSKEIQTRHFLEARHLTRIAYAYGVSKREDLDLFRYIAKTITIRDCNDQALSNVAWAFASLGFLSMDLFRNIEEEILRRKDNCFNAQDLANVAWAFASLAVDAPRLFETMADIIVEREAKGFTSQNAAITLWAFACSSSKKKKLFEVLFDSFEDDLNIKANSQVYLASVYAKKHLNVDSSLSSEKRPAAPSRLQRDVSRMLENDLGWSHILEHATPEGFSLDMAQPFAKVAIEVDGPSHFLYNLETGRRIRNGATRLKNRLLRAYGWHIAHVSFLEWTAATSDAHKIQLLSHKLKELEEEVNQQQLLLDANKEKRRPQPHKKQKRLGVVAARNGRPL